MWPAWYLSIALLNRASLDYVQRCVHIEREDLLTESVNTIYYYRICRPNLCWHIYRCVDATIRTDPCCRIHWLETVQFYLASALRPSKLSVSCDHSHERLHVLAQLTVAKMRLCKRVDVSLCESPLNSLVKLVMSAHMRRWCRAWDQAQQCKGFLLDRFDNGVERLVMVRPYDNDHKRVAVFLHQLVKLLYDLHVSKVFMVNVLRHAHNIAQRSTSFTQMHDYQSNVRVVAKNFGLSCTFASSV